MFNCISNITVKHASEIGAEQLNWKDLTFNNLYESAYIIYGMMLLQPLPEEAEHQNASFRNLLTWILLQTLLVSTAYSSGLSAVMTLPRYEPAIKTVDNLIDSGIAWGANDEAWLYTISGTTQVKMRFKRFSNCLNNN